jgi:hypothetical protein
MSRSFEECAESAGRELSRINGSWFQILRDVVEAVPANTAFGQVRSRIEAFAALVDRSPDTVERWRDTALAWSRFVNFPPQGGLAKVDYTVYRDLPGTFAGDVRAAHEFLVGVVESRPSAPRFSRPAIYEHLPDEIKTAEKARRKAGRAAGSAQENDVDAGAGGATALDEPLVEYLKKNLAPDLRKTLPAEAQIRLHLDEAVAVIEDLPPESRGYFEDVERGIKKALAALKSVDKQLSIGT